MQRERQDGIMLNDDMQPTGMQDEPMAPVAPPAAPQTRHISTTTKVIGGCLGCLGVLMAIMLVLGGLAAAIGFGILRQPALTATSTQAFTVTGTPTLTVRSAAGNVHVRAGDTNTVTVQITKTARGLSHDQEARYLNEMQVNMTQTGNAITIDEQSGDGQWWTFFGSRSLDITITTPAQTNLTDTLAAGNLDVTGLTGQFDIEESAGNIELTDVTLTAGSRVRNSAGNTRVVGQFTPDAALTLENSAGNITFDGALTTGNTLTVRNSAGNIALTLPQSTSARVSADCSAGNVAINGFPLGVNRDVANASANGTIGDPATTNTITANNSAGNITIDAR